MDRRNAITADFNPLVKLADWAIYFVCVNFFLFFMIARRQITSGSTEPIFTIISPNDRYCSWMIDLDLFSNSLRDVAMATNFKQNWQNDLSLAGWRSKTGKNITVPIEKYSMAIL